MKGTLLIANRGEIAVRIARTCRELGLRTVAVYSTADRDSPLLDLVDEAVHIGPAPARRSYLNVPALVEAARRTGAELIHPGYGFLSEDADFAEICEAEGLTFVGPTPATLRLLGDKAAARGVFGQVGLPVLPGTATAVEDPALARQLASGLGYPVVFKAVAGGGGRGIAVADRPEAVEAVYRQVVGQASALFGDGRVYLERYLPRCQHVEVQIVGDGSGGVAQLGTRGCSVQRRRQKLLEEAPAPGLSESLAERICEAAEAGARAVRYRGAGTFEFLVAGHGVDAEFYLSEVNCRIQVEHPVTELATGVDLVREQVLVAVGEAGPLRSRTVGGAAMECRINAEDPDRDFAPTPGRVTEFRSPGGPFTRVDTHLAAQMVVPPDYDPLLAKVVTWAPDRAQAIARMDRALGELRVAGEGLKTTSGFLRAVLNDPEFAAGDYGTDLLERMRARRPH